MPKLMQYSSGSIVFFAGDKDESIYILQKGTILLKTSDLETGVENTEQLRAGEFFGVKSALAQMPRIETAVAGEDSSVIQLSVPEFEKIFSTKQNVIEKMLRVFSKNLREIHKRTESIIKKNSTETPTGQGMFLVAKAFYNDEEYHTCSDILNRILQHHAATANKDEVEKLLKDSLIKDEQQEHEARLSRLRPIEEKSPENSLNQFSSPVFDRFTKNYKRGDVIISEFEHGETFYLIKSGKVQIVKTMNGQNKALDVLNPGELFGEMAILDNSPRTATCVARTDASCLEFNKANFGTLVLGNSQLVMTLLKLFSKRICDQRRRFKIVLIQDLQARIADIFMMYEEIYGVKAYVSEESTKRKFNLNLADIASWAGISQNQARDELNKMIEKHRIQMFDDYIIVANIHDMKRMVDSYYKKLADSADLGLKTKQS